jgi:hypothetical protein
MKKILTNQKKTEATHYYFNYLLELQRHFKGKELLKKELELNGAIKKVFGLSVYKDEQEIIKKYSNKKRK